MLPFWCAICVPTTLPLPTTRAVVSMPTTAPTLVVEPVASVATTEYTPAFTECMSLNVRVDPFAPAIPAPLRRHWYEEPAPAEASRMTVPPSGTLCETGCIANCGPATTVTLTVVVAELPLVSNARTVTTAVPPVVPGTRARIVPWNAAFTTAAFDVSTANEITELPLTDG